MDCATVVSIAAPSPRLWFERFHNWSVVDGSVCRGPPRRRRAAAPRQRFGRCLAKTFSWFDWRRPSAGIFRHFERRSAEHQREDQVGEAARTAGHVVPPPNM